MVRGGRKRAGGIKTADYRQGEEKRTNIPPAKIAEEGRVPKVEKARYYYSPHLPPVLRFDPTGEADKLPELIAEVARRPLTPEEQKLLAEALRNHEPWLEWAGKREQQEKGYFEVDPVALHIHERVSAQAIIRAAMREDVQRDLFARSSAAVSRGGAVLQEQHGLGESADPRGLPASHVVDGAAGELGGEGPDDLHRPAVRDQVWVEFSALVIVSSG